MEMILISPTELETRIAEGINKAIAPLIQIIKDAGIFLSPTATNRYLTTTEASEILKRTPKAIRAMVHRKQLKHYKRGERLYFLESDLLDWIKAGRHKTDEELLEGFEDDLLVKKGWVN